MRCPRSVTMPGGPSRCHSWSPGVDLPTSTEPCAGLLAVPWPDPPQVTLVIKYWTVLSVLAIILSLCFYVLATWATQSFWLFRVSPSTFPFLCEPPSGERGGGPWRRVRPRQSACCAPLRVSVFSAAQGCRAGGSVPSGKLHKGVLGAEGEEGGRVSGGGGTQQAPGRLHLGLHCDPDLSPDADHNVLSHPSILLVVLLNVSLNTLPTLALRVICQALKKAGPEVRGLGSPSHTLGTPSARACAGSRNSKTWAREWEE